MHSNEAQACTQMQYTYVIAAHSELYMPAHQHALTSFRQKSPMSWLQHIKAVYAQELGDASYALGWRRNPVHAYTADDKAAIRETGDLTWEWTRSS